MTTAKRADAIEGRRRAIGIALAAVACLSGTVALVVEARISFRHSFAKHRGLAEAIFLYLRYFTILTNIGLAALHGTTAMRLVRRRRLPSGGFFDAWLVYALVTGVTYEVLLRGTWSPQGEEFVADLVVHDVVPLLTLLVWLLAAPRTGVRWSDPLAMLFFPATYLLMTLVAGAYGEGYPYDFLDVTRIGLGNVMLVSLGFLVMFLTLGYVITALAKLRPLRSS